MVSVPHQLRTSFATELARIVNGNLLLVAHVLGHDSIVTTSGYTKYAVGPETLAIGQLWQEDGPNR
jgi:site-specific recombinase XerC